MIDCAPMTPDTYRGSGPRIFASEGIGSYLGGGWGGGGWVPDPGSQKAASENSASQSWPAAGGNFDGFEIKTHSEIAFLKVFGGINRIFFACGGPS